MTIFRDQKCLPSNWVPVNKKRRQNLFSGFVRFFWRSTSGYNYRLGLLFGHPLGSNIFPDANRVSSARSSRKLRFAQKYLLCQRRRFLGGHFFITFIKKKIWNSIQKLRKKRPQKSCHSRFRNCGTFWIFHGKQVHDRAILTADFEFLIILHLKFI